MIKKERDAVSVIVCVIVKISVGSSYQCVVCFILSNPSRFSEFIHKSARFTAKFTESNFDLAIDIVPYVPDRSIIANKSETR